MKFLQKFIGFSLNENISQLAYVSKKSSIFSDDREVNSEIIENCIDIIRDFNEEHDIQFSIRISPYERTSTKDDFMLIEAEVNSELSHINNNKLCMELYMHIVSYFRSIGYSYRISIITEFILPMLYVYKDISYKIESKSEKIFEDKVIWDHTANIDTEMYYTCNDIMRDFNEENNSHFCIDICHVRIDPNSYIENQTGLAGKEEVIGACCWDINRHENANVFRLRSLFFQHLAAYFNSLGYKNTEESIDARNYMRDCMFFYKEKLVN